MRKKGFLIATSAGFAAAATMPGAQAADMPIKAPRYVEPPAAASWAGWYIGAHAGAAWQQAQSLDYGTSFSNTSFIGGGQVGYNWQHGNFVFGLEGDISGLANKNKLYDGFSSSIRWLSTVRTRFGLAVGDTMAYATAGVAFGGVKNEVAPYSSTRTSVGWVVGGGVEHMLGRNWTIGLEGLFVDLGRSNLKFSHVEEGGTKSGRFRFSNQAFIGRLKLNYKF
jgi:outer membrane immunogenic protein